MNQTNEFYPRLFAPGKIGRLELANRIVMPAMSTNFPTASGEVSDFAVDYYSERARGGAGLIVVEHANIDFSRGQAGAVQLRIDDDSFLPGLRRLVEGVHRWGAKIALQINHVGGAGRKTVGGPYAPSQVPIDPASPPPKELTISDIQDIINKFGLAAKRAQKAGFDAIEIHGAHTYLISEFLCGATNKRQDEYGGDIKGRMRFALEVVARVRQSVGKDFPVIFRLNGEDFMAEGLTRDEAKEVARALEKATIDALHITAGGPYNGRSKTVAVRVEPGSFEQGWKSYLAAGIKQVVSIPVIAVGVIREPQVAESILEQEKADFVAIGRGLIADPEWPMKASQGKNDRIRKCISCNHCLWNRGRGWPLHCTVNAVAGRERELKELAPATRPKHICVIGGGPAGMELARIAAARGHSVTLYEQEKECGGQVIPGSVPPGKQYLKWPIEYLANDMRDSGVTVRHENIIGFSQIEKEKYDVAVVATGAVPVIPKSLTEAGQKALKAVDVLSGKVSLSQKKVVVVGGGSVGCETALYLAKQDNRVTVVEMLGEAVNDLPPTNQWDLLNSLYESGVAIRLNTRVIKVKDRVVTVATEQGKAEIPADCVVLATGSRSENSLAEEIKGRVPELYVIGDARCPGRIIDAIYEGHMLGRSL